MPYLAKLDKVGQIHVYVLSGDGMCMTYVITHSVINICPVITDSTTPYPHLLLLLLLVLCVPSPKGDNFQQCKILHMPKTNRTAYLDF
jgi:hypothetical protein